VTTPVVPLQGTPTRRQKNFRLPHDLTRRIADHATRQGISETAAATLLLTEAVTLAELRAGIGHVTSALGPAAGAALRDLVSAVELADTEGIERDTGEADGDGADRGETTTSSRPAPSVTADHATPGAEG
jgi:hypothetical protein